MAAQNETNRPTPKASRIGKVILPLAVIVALAVYVASGVFVVQPNQRGVVRHFGRIVEPNALPGMHFALPWPFGRVDRPEITNKRLIVGQDPEVRAAIAAGDLVARSESLATDVLTGDVNIVKTTLAVQYQVTKPDHYLFSTVTPDQLVEAGVQSVVVETLGGMSIDQALTEGKAVVENVTREQAQAMLNRYDCGITLAGVSLESIEPPFAINDAFKEVASAKKDRERNIDEAHGFGDMIVRRARGTAAEILAEARGYRDIRTSQAKGETQRFESLLAEYRKAPDITRTRLVMDTLSEIMERARVFVVPADKLDAPMRLTITDN